MGMKQNKNALIAYKLLFGLLGFSALVTEVATLVERGSLNLVNFLSFFTVESNIIVAVVLLLSALATAGNKNNKLDTVRSAAAVYILIVGFGFSLLLSGLDNTIFTAVPWDNIVLHYIMPVAMLVDIIIDRPGKQLFKRSLAWLLFPIAYLAYSLVRGTITGWYPYPFLNPADDGYGAVIVTVAGMLILATGITWAICMLTNKKSTKRKQ